MIYCYEMLYLQHRNCMIGQIPALANIGTRKLRNQNIIFVIELRRKENSLSLPSYDNSFHNKYVEIKNGLNSFCLMRSNLAWWNSTNFDFISKLQNVSLSFRKYGFPKSINNADFYIVFPLNINQQKQDLLSID